MSTTFEREPDLNFRGGHIYSRETNPNRRALESSIRQLEGGAAAACYASGTAVTNTVLQSLGPDAHVIFPDDAYYGTIKLARDVFAAWGLRFTCVDMSDLRNVENAMTDRTRLVWIETPTNPLLRVVDIAAIARIAKDNRASVIVDNTVASPVLQRPLALGADFVMHSATKHLGGHSDLLLGALVAADENHPLFMKARFLQGTGGAVPSPFECWLALRGIRTLALRVRAQTASAERIAEFLYAHKKIEAVHYPGLPSHPGHEIAKRQMAAPGALLSFQVRGGRDAAIGVSNRLTLFTRATSLGTTESLIEHRHSVEGPHTRAPENLLRISVGLEHVDDLVEDLEQGLA
jgi:cystathionine gamma-synthase